MKTIIQNNELCNAIKYALKEFYSNDYDNFFKEEKENDKITSVYEVAISCKLGVYIFNSLKDEKFFEGEYKDFSVDMEYDRVGEKLDMKYLDGYKRKFGKTGNIRPDIIIHNRGKSGRENNLCVFEIKKNGLEESDIYKLENMTNDGTFDYQYGIGLSNFTQEKTQIDVFINGESKHNFYFDRRTGKINIKED